MIRIFTLSLLLFSLLSTRAQSYTLGDADVVVVDGYIQSCSYDFSNKDIIIPSTLDGQSVIGIAYKIFNGKNLNSIELPNTLIRIEDEAFSSNSLKEVNLPGSLEYIGHSAFKYNQLSSVTIPSSTAFIGPYSFYSNELTAVTLTEPSALYNLGTWAFAYNSGLSEIKLPINSNPEFRNYFDDNGQIYAEGDIINDFQRPYLAKIPYTLKDDDVVVENGVIISCSYNFDSKDIIIPNTLDNQTVIGIEKEVFQGKNIEALELPESLESIGMWSFGGNNIENLVIPGNLRRIGYGAFRLNKLSTLTIPKNVEIIEGYAFNFNQISSVTIEENSMLHYIDYGAFNGHSENLKTIKLPSNANPEFEHYIIDGKTYRAGDVVNIPTSAIIANLPYTLTESDILIQNGYIEKCYLTDRYMSIIIPETIGGETIIGISDKEYPDRVFKELRIVVLNLPNTLKHIGKYSFYENNLFQLSIPTGVESIGDKSFANNKLDNVSFESNSSLYFIDKYAFLNNDRLTSGITLPTNNTAGFLNYVSESGDILNAGETISDFSISYQANIAYTLQSNDVVVEDGYIISCSYGWKAKSIIIPEVLNDQTIIGIKGSGLGVFGFKDLYGVTLPNTLKHIGENSFTYNNLLSLSLPSGLQKIDKNAFAVNWIKEITIPSSVETIGNRAFSRNLLTMANFESNSNIKSIKPYVFEKNEQLVEVQLPIHQHTAFSEYYDDQGNHYAEGLKVNDYSRGYYARIPYTLSNDDVEMKDHQIISCSYNFELKDIIIPEELDGIQVRGIAGESQKEGVFQGKGIKSVQFPTALSYIGENAFKSNQIVDFKASNALQHIERLAFTYNQLRHIALPNSIIKIGEFAFYQNQLETVLLEDNSDLLSIDYAAFADNIDLTSITLPSNRQNGFTQYKNDVMDPFKEGETIADFETTYYADAPYTLSSDDIKIVDGLIDTCTYNFDRKVLIIPDMIMGTSILGIANKSIGVFQNKGIQELELAEGIEHIGELAFNDNSLNVLHLPQSTQYIGKKAFHNNKLPGLLIPSDVKTIGDHAFNGNRFYNNNEPIIFDGICNLLSLGKNAFGRGNFTEGVSSFPEHADASFEYYIDEEGNTYNAGDKLINLDLAYFAKVAPVTIQFNRNSEASGSLPADINLQIYESFIVPGEGNLKLIDFDFIGWNSQSDGKGTNYPAGQEMSAPTESITLYAQWQEKVGIDNIYADAISFYPNPAKNNLHFKAEQQVLGKTFVIQSLSGMKVLQKNITAEYESISLTNLPSGMYIISIDNLPIAKIIKQ